MKKLILKSSMLFLLSIGFSVLLNAQIIVNVRPSNPVFVRAAPPSPQHIWVDGDWVPQGNHYVYRNGYWFVPGNRGNWNPGYWNQQGNGWKWKKGYWGNKNYSNHPHGKKWKNKEWKNKGWKNKKGHD